MTERNRRIEFGDFQTPDSLAESVCQRLAMSGINPDIIIEPTCGSGAFIRAAAKTFFAAKKIIGFDINSQYLEDTRDSIEKIESSAEITIDNADFFSTDWNKKIDGEYGNLLVIGNFPWVTNAAQGVIGGSNLPEKSNFQNHNGFDAITGKANFDISEWMLLDVLRWLGGRGGDVAMLVKTAVARKVLSYAQRERVPMRESSIIAIDAKKNFGASVDACLLIMRIAKGHMNHDYMVFNGLDSSNGRRVGHRMGLTVSDLDSFKSSSFLLGKSPQKWRSGVKHDAAGIMEFTKLDGKLRNGLGEIVSIEEDYLFPLLKGSDIGSGKTWREKYVLVTQRRVGEETEEISKIAPKTWDYLNRHSSILDGRRSIIYAKNPRFSVFGIGEYAFKPWKIAICGLYKSLSFRLVAPIEDRPAIFDDTVYYLSFEDEQQARSVLELISSQSAMSLMSSLIFWDEKRPIKTSVLNLLDWTRVDLKEIRATTAA